MTVEALVSTYMAENAYASAIFLLLNKTDYDIDTEIRTVELLKAIPPLFFFTLKLKLLAYFYSLILPFSLLCQIDTFWRSDLIDSKRVNTNVKKRHKISEILLNNITLQRRLLSV